MSDINPYISEAIWFQILQELPVKTLGKCRCVCKSWHSLIVSPSFMGAHLKHYTQNESNSLLLLKEGSYSSNKREKEHCVFFRDSAQLKEGNSNLHTSFCPFILRDDWWAGYHLAGSIHGLLCLYDNAYNILIWNPFLKKSIVLPSFRVLELGLFASNKSEVGFGYAFSKNDYKVVKISDRRQLIEVYSVKERAWRKISADYLTRNSIHSVFYSQCFLNGVVHWITSEDKAIYDKYNISKWLLLFDVTGEAFEKMELPEAISVKDSTGNFGVFEYRNKLSVSYTKIHCWETNIDISACCQIWVKQEYNVSSSWCKILNAVLDDCYHLGPIQYLAKNEELLGFTNENTGELVSYDNKTKQVKGTGHFVSSSTRFSAYSESLVLLDHKSDARIANELHRSVYNSNHLVRVFYPDLPLLEDEKWCS